MSRMAANSTTPSLGKGSVAAFMKVALDIAWVVLWVAAGLLVIAILAYIGVVIAMETGVLPKDTLAAGDHSAGLGPLTVTANSDNELVLPIVAPALIAGAVAIGGSLVIVWRLRQLFANITTGEPFNRDNANHLRVIGFTMMVMELARYVIAGAVILWLINFGQPTTRTLKVDVDINWMTWGAIAILIVFAEVFREGARLKEEQELTI